MNSGGQAGSKEPVLSRRCLTESHSVRKRERQSLLKIQKQESLPCWSAMPMLGCFWKQKIKYRAGRLGLGFLNSVSLGGRNENILVYTQVSVFIVLIYSVKCILSCSSLLFLLT